MQNLPIELYRADQIKELETFAIQKHGISGIELMSRAGHAVFQNILQQYSNIHGIAVFCGSGNNAGDGYIIARLALKTGIKACVYTLCDPARLQGDALTAYLGYMEAQGEVLPFYHQLSVNADIIVDALFGTGLNRQVTGAYIEAIAAINNSGVPVLAVDIPSGLNSNTGAVMGCAVKANSTFTFIGLKQGLFTGQAAEYCGTIFYSSLAVPDEILYKLTPSALRVTPKHLAHRHRCTHKGNNGHVLIIGGDLGFSGAVRLAGEAALRVGAGLVTIATRLEHSELINISRPELMCHGVMQAGQLAVLLEKASVIVIGPGLGQSAWAKALLSVTLRSDKPMIVDADGLNLLATTPTSKTNWILTPHPKEAARLLNCTTGEIQADRFAAASALQAEYQGVCVLKGAGSLVVSNEGIAISNTGNPGMATAGMGDILSGVIAGLLAQGFSLQKAAEQGVYGHGKAADLATKHHGERGLLASDLMPYLRLWINS